MLKRLHIHNVMTFVNFEWAPPQACVLVGENGAGKSALIDVLRLLQALIVDGNRIDEMGTPAARTAWLQQPEQMIEVDIEYQEDLFRYRLTIRTEEGKSALSEELIGGGSLLYRANEGTVELFGDVPSEDPRATLAFDRRRSFLSVLEARQDNKRLIAFRQALQSMWLMKPDPFG